MQFHFWLQANASRRYELKGYNPQRQYRPQPLFRDGGPSPTRINNDFGAPGPLANEYFVNDTQRAQRLREEERERQRPEEQRFEEEERILSNIGVDVSRLYGEIVQSLLQGANALEARGCSKRGGTAWDLLHRHQGNVKKAAQDYDNVLRAWQAQQKRVPPRPASVQNSEQSFQWSPVHGTNQSNAKVRVVEPSQVNFKIYPEHAKTAQSLKRSSAQSPERIGVPSVEQIVNKSTSAKKTGANSFKQPIVQLPPPNNLKVDEDQLSREQREIRQTLELSKRLAEVRA